MREAAEEFGVGERTRFAVGGLELLREGKFVGVVGQMRGEGKHFAAEMEMAGAGKFHARTVAPTREPLEEIDAGEENRFAAGSAVRVNAAEPFDEFPVVGREKFVFVRGACGEVDDLGGRFEFFAGARAEEVKLNFEGVEGGLIFQRDDVAGDAHAGARGVEMRLGAREQPFFKLLDEFLFLLGLLDFREAFEVRVRH